MKAVDAVEDASHRARIAELLRQGRELRQRAEKAKNEARALVAKSTELIAAEDRRLEREALVRRTTDALNIAKASAPVVLGVPVGRGKKSA